MAGALAACRPPAPGLQPLARNAMLQLAGDYVMARPDAAHPVRLGGISGLAALRDGAELLGVSDDRENSRVYRFRVTGGASDLHVDPVGVVSLERAAGAPARLDPEGIAVTADGHILISSEGIGNEEPRLPPAIIEYSNDGRFIRQLEVRSRLAPNRTGPVTTGARNNAGLEALTISPEGRLFTAVEAPLVQDGDASAFGAAKRTRLLEYVAAGGLLRPAREFAYDISPVEPPAFPPAVAVNGIVELLALGGDELLALERGYIESPDKSQFLNRIRIFRISLDGATDVSTIESLAAAAGVTPIRKTLVADFNQFTGLSPALKNLDNFEGMAWGPRQPDGSRPLLVVSDDNFAPRQVTAFVALLPAPPGRPARGAFR
jgi:hypothetical protein